MEGQKSRFWPMLVLILLIFGAVLAGIYLYPRERQAVSDATGAQASLFGEGDLNNNNENTVSTSTQIAVILHTNQGDITVELYPDKAPKTVANFIKLAKEGFYNGTLFHRVIKGFMIQGGDPLSREKDWRLHGTGGPGYKFDDEQNDLGLERGILAMANSGPNTNGSQFFIMTARQPMQLAGYYTSFGKVIGDFTAVDKIEATPVNENDHPLSDMIINSIEIK
ncbi:MAG: peptidylprolyl isomerase [Candidatus Vogelbacteria bacterium]|nr:peptidylprolyl isomerase [Candidatus Vogelbacteria bacterium]